MAVIGILNIHTSIPYSKDKKSNSDVNICMPGAGYSEDIAD